MILGGQVAQAAFAAANERTALDAVGPVRFSAGRVGAASERETRGHLVRDFGFLVWFGGVGDASSLVEVVGGLGHPVREAVERFAPDT